jgi:hypothetical protein
MLCLPGTRKVMDAMRLGSISLRSKGMELLVKRGVLLVTTEGEGSGVLRSRASAWAARLLMSL